jgi:hypothetical protein
MGIFSLIALVLIAAKAFGFLALGWLWCFAPILIDVVLGVGALVLGYRAVKKTSNIMADGFKDSGFDEVFSKAKDRLG